MTEQHRRTRRGSWTLRCAGAELIGMTAAAAAGSTAQHLVSGRPPDAARWAAAALIVGGGLVEGVALGMLQAGGLRYLLTPSARRRWIAVTVAVAGIGWALGSAPAAFASSDRSAAGPPVLLVELGALALGAVMGVVLGAVQAGVLHGRVPRPGRWVLGNGLAWPPALAIVFAGASAPALTTPVPMAMAIGAGTGALAGAVLGVITAAFLPDASSTAREGAAVEHRPAA